MNITSLKNGSLFIGGTEILNKSQTIMAGKALGVKVERFGGLKFRPSKQIINGGSILDRSENHSIATIGRFDGGGVEDDRYHEYGIYEKKSTPPVPNPYNKITTAPVPNPYNKITTAPVPNPYNKITTAPVPNPYKTTNNPEHKVCFKHEYDYEPLRYKSNYIVKELDRILYENKLKQLENDFKDLVVGYKKPKTKRKKTTKKKTKKKKSTKKKTKKKKKPRSRRNSRKIYM